MLFRSLDIRWLFWAALCLPISLVGTRLGLMAYGRFDDAQFRKIMLAMLGISGVTLIVTSLH